MRRMRQVLQAPRSSDGPLQKHSFGRESLAEVCYCKNLSHTYSLIVGDVVKDQTFASAVPSKLANTVVFFV